MEFSGVIGGKNCGISENIGDTIRQYSIRHHRINHVMIIPLESSLHLKLIGSNCCDRNNALGHSIQYFNMTVSLIDCKLYNSILFDQYNIARIYIADTITKHNLYMT